MILNKDLRIEDMLKKGELFEINHHQEAWSRGKGWCLTRVRGGYYVRMWKAIKNEWESIKCNPTFHGREWKKGRVLERFVV